jgi:P-type Cu2+ transporter
MFDEADSPTGAPHVCLADDAGWLATFELQEGLREDAAAPWRPSGPWGCRPGCSRVTASCRAAVGQKLGMDAVIAGASPEHKLAEVVRLQGQGKRIAMVGDGLNDGPVLAERTPRLPSGMPRPWHRPSPTT